MTHNIKIWWHVSATDKQLWITGTQTHRVQSGLWHGVISNLAGGLGILKSSENVCNMAAISWYANFHHIVVPVLDKKYSSSERSEVGCFISVVYCQLSICCICNSLWFYLHQILEDRSHSIYDICYNHQFVYIWHHIYCYYHHIKMGN